MSEFKDTSKFTMEMINLRFIDEEDILKMKEDPSMRTKITELHVAAIVRRISREEEVAVNEEEDYVVNLEAEHFRNKELSRKHHAVSREYKVRRGQKTCKNSMKKVYNKIDRRRLNAFADQDPENDVIRTYRSTFSSNERISWRGKKLF